MRDLSTRKRAAKRATSTLLSKVTRHWKPVVVGHALEAWDDVSQKRRRSLLLRTPKKPALPSWPREMDKTRRRSAQPFHAKDFLHVATAGRGAFGAVIIAAAADEKTSSSSHRRRLVALKVYEKEKLLKCSLPQAMFRERKALLALEHAFLCEMLFAFQTATRCFYGMPYYVGGSLAGRRCDVEGARFYACEIAAGVDHLHSWGVVHRDLKPENVLVDALGHVVVADFGLVAETGTVVEDSFVGTAQFAAPECLLKKHVVAPSQDYWALGVLLFELVKGVRPFEAPTLREEWTSVLRVKSCFAKHGRTGDVGLDALLERVLVRAPADRLATLDDFRATPFVRDHIDWAALLRKELVPPPSVGQVQPPPYVADDGVHLNPDFDLSRRSFGIDDDHLHRPSDDLPQPDLFRSAFSGFAVFSREYFPARSLAGLVVH